MRHYKHLDMEQWRNPHTGSKHEQRIVTMETGKHCARRSSPVGVSGSMGVHVTLVAVRTTSWLFLPIWKIPRTIGSSALYFVSFGAWFPSAQRPSSVGNWGAEADRFSPRCCFLFFFFTLTRFSVPPGDTGCVSCNSSWLSDHAWRTFVDLRGDSNIMWMFTGQKFSRQFAFVC